MLKICIVVGPTFQKVCQTIREIARGRGPFQTPRAKIILLSCAARTVLGVVLGRNMSAIDQLTHNADSELPEIVNKALGHVFRIAQSNASKSKVLVASFWVLYTVLCALPQEDDRTVQRRKKRKTNEE